MLAAVAAILAKTVFHAVVEMLQKSEANNESLQNSAQNQGQTMRQAPPDLQGKPAAAASILDTTTQKLQDDKRIVIQQQSALQKFFSRTTLPKPTPSS
jgi:TRAP-type mannitol/chloroaromatic compound transport system substrate-binding protein